MIFKVLSSKVVQGWTAINGSLMMGGVLDYADPLYHNESTEEVAHFMCPTFKRPTMKFDGCSMKTNFSDQSTLT